ncbi:GNAT family N-acetyltransferase [Bacillus alkalicellulosilyticus]|uniref:GNAT family N-acetyltransferase n=1 Tax=Alkalihalobacterium alkalicellulosilyticum TaxID=1912214 RepID=UPI001482FBFA|nr:GNAT family protein [Bacillus alkalicellulosilyticus]
MNVKLLPLNGSDHDLVHKIYTDEGINDSAVLGYWQPISHENIKQRIDSWLSGDKQKHFKIVSEGNEVGLAQIYGISLVNRKCTLGILISDEYQGKGIGRKTLEALLDISFLQLNLDKVEVSILSYNDKSIKLFEHFHFIHEGTLRQSVFKKGQYHNVCMYGLLKEEYITL